MSGLYDAGEWNRILLACSVRPTVAALWSEVFADVVKDGSFSQGREELDDFLGQVLHESCGLTRLAEYLNYSARRIREIGFAARAGTRWRAAAARAEQLAGNPEVFANFIYGGRMGNGPAESGDGWRFRGRGPIQLTGRDNYAFVGDLVGQDLTVLPELMEQPRYALEATIAWWEKRIPDSMIGDPERITQRVNGGLMGLADREELAEHARRAMA